MLASSMEERPAPRRKPSTALSGAPTRGPLRSSRVAAEPAGTPATCKARRLGVAKALAPSYGKPASTKALVTSDLRSSAALRCIRAGISSLNSSSRRSGMEIWAFGLGGMRLETAVRPLASQQPLVTPFPEFITAATLGTNTNNLSNLCFTLLQEIHAKVLNLQSS